jgi:hypothetical protein
LESIEKSVIESIYSYALDLEKVVSCSSVMTLASKYSKIAVDEGLEESLDFYKLLNL